MKVPPGFSVELYNKKDLEGKRMTIIGNKECLEKGYTFAWLKMKKKLLIVQIEYFYDYYN